MKKKTTWTGIVYSIGAIALLIGVLDPLEGSVVILSGSLLIAFSTYVTNDRHWKLFLSTFLMIAIGVFFLFYLSSLGGFGGNSAISWWWGLLILPYPIGWLANITLLITRTVRSKKTQITA